MSEPAQAPDFEAALAELEALVQRMETGTLTLEDSLRAFERGVQLSRQCQQSLQQAELRVKTLMRDGTEAPAERNEAGDGP